MTTATLLSNSPHVALLERQENTVETFEARLDRLFPKNALTGRLVIEDIEVNSNIQRMALAVRNIILDGAGIPDVRLLDAIRASFHSHAPSTRW